MSEKKLDCPKCGNPMLWKYLTNPLCGACDAEAVEKIYSKKNHAPKETNLMTGNHKN